MRSWFATGGCGRGKPKVASLRRRVAAEVEVEEFRRGHPGDDQAQAKARREIHERHRVNASASCVPPLVLVVATQAVALWSPLNQTPAERIAGILVVQD